MLNAIQLPTEYYLGAWTFILIFTFSIYVVLLPWLWFPRNYFMTKLARRNLSDFFAYASYYGIISVSLGFICWTIMFLCRYVNIEITTRPWAKKKKKCSWRPLYLLWMCDPFSPDNICFFLLRELFLNQQTLAGMPYVVRNSKLSLIKYCCP